MNIFWKQKMASWKHGNAKYWFSPTGKWWFLVGAQKWIGWWVRQPGGELLLIGNGDVIPLQRNETRRVERRKIGKLTTNPKPPKPRELVGLYFGSYYFYHQWNADNYDGNCERRDLSRSRWDPRPCRRLEEPERRPQACPCWLKRG